ncbi:MAG: VCBS repeat-containing protein, partial [Myxococcales bacterium]
MRSSPSGTTCGARREGRKGARPRQSGERGDGWRLRWLLAITAPILILGCYGERGRAASSGGDAAIDGGVRAGGDAARGPDVAAEARVSLTAGASQPGGSVLRAVALADADRDGRLDLAILDGGPPATVNVLLNLGAGRFAAAAVYDVGQSPQAIAFGDISGDGAPDLVIANRDSGDISVLLNRGDGTFTTAASYAAGTGPRALAVADLTGDGRADVAVANDGSGDVAVLVNRGDGTFGAAKQLAVGGTPQALATGDLDGDGRVDLVVARGDASGGGISVLMNRGEAVFAEAVVTAPGTVAVAVAVGDLDGDGRADLAVAQGGAAAGHQLAILINASRQGGPPEVSFGAAQPIPSGASPVALAIADLDADGRGDLAVANDGSGDITALLNQGDGTFTGTAYAAGEGPVGVAVGDLDGDHLPDVVVGNGSGGNVTILHNQGGGRLGAPTYAAGARPFG